MRINWTTRERRLVAEEMMKMEEAFPQYSFYKLINSSQTGLPESRRRHINGIDGVPWMSSEKQNIIREREFKRKHEVVKPEPVVTKPEPVKSEVIDSMVEKLLAKLPDLLVDRLAAKLLDKLSERLLSKDLSTNTALTSVVQPATVPSLAIPAKEKLTKVLVVGVLPVQARELQTEFLGLLDVRVWKEEGPKTLKALVQTSSLVVLMADKISHSTQNLVKRNQGGNCHLSIVSGGIHALKDELEKFYLEKV